MGILLVGSHGTGKSTLAKEIQKMFPYKIMIIDNIHREAKEDGFQINKTNDVVSQMETVKRYLEKVRKLGDKTFITVDSILRQTAYARHNRLPKTIIGLMEELCLVEKKYFVDSTKIESDRNLFEPCMVVYLPIEFPLEKDNVREADVKFQKDIDNEIVKLLTCFYRYKQKGLYQFYTITGTVEERTEKLFKLIIQGTF